MNAPDWLAAFAEKLGTPAPTKDELKAVLDLAAEAAHSSQRISAPVACWLAARAGVDPERALELAQEIDAGPPDG
jgi:alkylhydroperoxidase family enzyme